MLFSYLLPMYTISFLFFQSNSPKFCILQNLKYLPHCQSSAVLLFFSCWSLSGNLRLNTIIFISTRSSIQDLEHLSTAEGIAALRCQSRLHSKMNANLWLEGVEDGEHTNNAAVFVQQLCSWNTFLGIWKSRVQAFYWVHPSAPISLMLCYQMSLP